MTKLLEWLSVFIVVFTTWFNVYTNQKSIPYFKDNPNLIIYIPFILVVLFGLYAVTVVLYRVLTFNNCEEAAKELQKEIQEARKSLAALGFKFKEKSS